MEYLIKSLPEIEKKMRSYPGCMLMLDFDGTLSALAKTPAQAFLAEKNKMVLQLISRLAPVAIVTGRSLKDIKHKVGLKKNIYAGNHGLEWEIDCKRGGIKIPTKMVVAVNFLNKQLSNLCRKYHGALLENKHMGLSLHYRLVKTHLVDKLLKEAMQLVVPFQKKQLLKITKGKKLLDVRLALSWNKGDFVKFLHKKLGKDLLPIYIGDDVTDEDVFNILRPGITIQVAKNSNSKAKYYCNNTVEVSLFLSWFLNKLRSTKKH